MGFQNLPCWCEKNIPGTIFSLAQALEAETEWLERSSIGQILLREDKQKLWELW